ncbi:MAG: neutral/alkaline non-lysosomal ceramidase N-terminal domain-containing protein, partial [Oscillospiraceae bacterium]|nr:neutral/alkaline non-lysosomal ceramidase N-terminal domain-containing protein [Oscillospiraceae bacterium]
MDIKSSNFFVGVAKEDITPELGCLLYGYPFERRAERILDSLMVGVVAIRQGEETLLLISADLCALNVAKCTDMRKEISKATGVKWENILYSTIHTHSGPTTRTTAGWGDADLEYINDILVPKSIKAANEALKNLQPAVMGIGTSETMTGINRRQIDENGDVILGQNPDGPYDPTMTIISFKTVSGANIGSLIHFAAHPTAAARNLSFSRDWPGLMVDKVEELTDAPCVYFNGAEGDVGPRLSNGRTGGGEEYIVEAGLIAAADIEKAYHNIGEYTVPE